MDLFIDGNLTGFGTNFVFALVMYTLGFVNGSSQGGSKND